MEKQGSLACVGLGMTLGAHLGPRSRNHIEQADVVFVAVSDPLVELWVQEMHPDVRSLQPYYREGKPRTETYREMVEAMLAEVRAGRRVCGAFYGHPGVFAQAPHRAIAQVQVGEIEPEQFRQAQAGRVEQLHDRLVAHAEVAGIDAHDLAGGGLREVCAGLAKIGNRGNCVGHGTGCVGGGDLITHSSMVNRLLGVISALPEELAHLSDRSAEVTA